MKPCEIGNMLYLVGKCSYNEPNKAKFRRLSMKLMRATANAMRLPPGSYEVRWNAGGIAVSGDAYLHGDHVYVNMNADGICGGLGVLVRTCRGRKDYSGGRNQWYNFSDLAHDGVEGLAKFASGVMAEAVRG